MQISGVSELIVMFTRENKEVPVEIDKLKIVIRFRFYVFHKII